MAEAGLKFVEALFGWRQNLETVLLLSLGGILGTNLRYWLGAWILRAWGSEYPLHTLLINLSGCFLLAFFLTATTSRFPLNPNWRIFFAIGVLGSYTTFSTYTFESIALVTAGDWKMGLLNLFGSSTLGGLAAILGVVLGRII
jgi:CrcB protein